MTPDQLDMNDLDTIMVTNMDRVSEGLEGNATTTGATHSHNHGHLLSISNAGKKSKKKRETPLSRPSSIERTHEELKIEVPLACLVSVDNYFFGKRAHISYLSFFSQHSKVLTKIHEEAHPLFMQIRQRLNSLSIKRSQPKVKPRRPKFIPPLPEILTDFHPTSDGKAGKSHYIVQVGDIKDLYKKSKPRRGSPSLSHHHRFTRFHEG